MAGVFAAAALIMPASNASGQIVPCDEPDPDCEVIVSGTQVDSFKVEFLGRVVETNGSTTTTYSYRVTNGLGRALSHWVVELCESLEVVGWTPDVGEPIGSTAVVDVSVGFDPTTGIWGIKWDLNGNLGSGVFSFTLEGDVPFTARWASVKSGGTQGLQTGDGTITGPYCADGECDVEDVVWMPTSGEDVYIVGGTDPTATVSVAAVNGFHTVVIWPNLSVNMGILDVTDNSGTSLPDLDFGGPISSAFHGGTLYESVVYEGLETFENIQVVFAPLEVGGSRFMFSIEDQIKCQLQIDPAIEWAAPEAYQLGQNYPNPFNPQTSIRFQMPEAAQVQLDVYDVMGRRVRTLLSGRLEAGQYDAVWDGTDASGRAVASGAYFYRLQSDDFTETRQMLLLK
jgi:hypothetical protein